MGDGAILFALTMMVCIVAPLSGQDCSEAQCLNAFHNLTKHRSVIMLNDVLPSWNMTQLQQLCVSYDEFSVCMKPVLLHCSLDKQLAHAGINDAYQYLCTNSTIAEYLKYQSCFGGTDLRRKVNLCNETLQMKSSSARASSNSKERRRKFCEYYDDYLACVNDSVRPACGEKATDWQNKFAAKLHQPVLDKIACSDFSESSGWSVMAIIVSALVILTIVLMSVVIAAFVFVVSRRHRVAERPSRGRQHRRRSAAPSYDAPYVVYAGPDGDPQLHISDSSFSGVLVKPPPYVEDCPPPPFTAVDQQTANTGPQGPGDEASQTVPDSDEHRLEDV